MFVTLDLVFMKGRQHVGGRDERGWEGRIEATRAESQWIVAARPLCHLQYPGTPTARQYRCGPPPEFPLASPRSGIVHHLSGPDRYALTRTFTKDQGRSAVQPTRGSHQSASLRLTGYSPVDSHTCQTPWSVFQDGSNGEPTGRRQERASAEARRISARCRPQS
ncbi:hypothetical protein KIW84_UN0769 [Lathyrus oleraceus]|nr:hypothetical protein KIW84_UN0769 [Pisum sativum]